MSEHVAYVVEVKNLRPHTNADRLQIATFFGNDTCVSLGVKIGDKGIYIPTDIQLSQEFCDANHLCRKTKDGEPDTGYMDENKRNVKAIKLRGEKSDGIYLPLTCLETFMDISTLKVGDTIGEPYVRKYIPRGIKNARGPREGNRTRKHKTPIAPLFAEHADTEQLVYHLGEFRENDLVEITLKIHGTSQRTGYLPVLKGYKSRFPLWNKLLQCDYNKLGKGAKKLYDQALGHATPIYEWESLKEDGRMVASTVLMNSVSNTQSSSTVNFIKAKRFIMRSAGTLILAHLLWHLSLIKSIAIRISRSNMEKLLLFPMGVNLRNRIVMYIA